MFALMPRIVLSIFFTIFWDYTVNISWKMSQTLTAIYDKKAFFMLNVIIQCIVNLEKSIFTQSDTLIRNIYHFSPL